MLSSLLLPHNAQMRLTIVTLGDSVLDSSALRKVRNLSPILVWIGAGAEGAAGILCGSVLGWICPGKGILVTILTLHVLCFCYGSEEGRGMWRWGWTSLKV